MFITEQALSQQFIIHLNSVLLKLFVQFCSSVAFENKSLNSSKDFFSSPTSTFLLTLLVLMADRKDLLSGYSHVLETTCRESC